MGDTPSTTTTTTIVTTTTDAAIAASTALKGVGEETDHTIGVFNKLSDVLGDVMLQIAATGTLTDKQSDKFAILTSFVLKSETAFSGLSISAGSMASTFSGSMQSMQDEIGKLNFGEAASKAQGLGIDISKIAAAGVALTLGALQGALVRTATHMAENADYALRLQASYLRLSAGTGQFADVIRAAGPNLENMNSLLTEQAKRLGDTIEATGASKGEVVGYYTALGAIPGALKETIKTGGAADQSMNMLTATMKLATGTGQTFSEVTEKLNKSFETYGTSGQAALEFTASISELSQKYGIKLDDISSRLMTAGTALSKFNSSVNEGGKIAKGAAEIFNQYEQSLKDTGLSGKAAADVIVGMTNALGGMTIAQQGFLSAQTGGPGGLMGGFQIEKMMRDGDVKGVFDKVRKQMQDQMGPIVSLQEATQDQGAASQRQKQMQILQGGALGQFAKSDQDASHLLDALKGGDVSTALGGKDFMGKAIETGTQIQEKSYTKLSAIAAHTEALSLLSGVGALSVMQDAFTASKGRKSQDQSPEAAQRESERTSELKGSMKFGESGDTGPGSAVYRQAMDFKRLIVGLPKTAQDSLHAIMDIFSGSGSESDKLAKEKVRIEAAHDDIARRMSSAVSSKDTTKVAALDKELKDFDMAEASIRSLSSPFKPITAGAKVGESVTAATAGKSKEASMSSGAAGKEEHSTDRHLKITAICLHCREALEADPGGSVSSVAARAK